MNIQKINIEESDRIETGPIQFNDDWPGYFIRGDNAINIAFMVEEVLAGGGDIAKLQLESFVKDLRRVANDQGNSSSR